MGQKFAEESLVDDYGVVSACDLLISHVRSGLTSGFSLGDLKIFLLTEEERKAFKYNKDDHLAPILIRFRFKPDTWLPSRDVEKEEFGRYETKVDNSESKISSTDATQKKMAEVSETTNKVVPSKDSRKKKAKVSHKETPIDASDEATAAPNLSKAMDEPSCYYAPFCKMAGNKCGGIRSGLCQEVLSGRIVIPPHEEFLKAKKKYQNAIKKERKATREAKRAPANVKPSTLVDALASSPATSTKQTDRQDEPGASSTDTTVTEHTKNGKRKPLAASKPTSDHSSTASTVTEQSRTSKFNPREFVLLQKALDGSLSEKDMKDDGLQFTKWDCDAVARWIKNDVAEAFEETCVAGEKEAGSNVDNGSETAKSKSETTIFKKRKKTKGKDESDNKAIAVSEPKKSKTVQSSNNEGTIENPVMSEHQGKSNPKKVDSTSSNDEDTVQPLVTAEIISETPSAKKRKSPRRTKAINEKDKGEMSEAQGKLNKKGKSGTEKDGVEASVTGKGETPTSKTNKHTRKAGNVTGTSETPTSKKSKRASKAGNEAVARGW
jgi:hypothetical protein